MISKYASLKKELSKIEHKRSILKRDLEQARINESTQTKIIQTTIQLINDLERPIRPREIFFALKNVSIGRNQDYKRFYIDSVLAQEINKKSARIKRVGRGLYDLK